MGEAKLRADEIEKAKADAIARHEAQVMHGMFMQHPATFAPSFYLADAAGMVRLVMHEPGANGEPVVRGAFVITADAAMKLADVLPKFVVAMGEARKQAQDNPIRVSTVDQGYQGAEPGLQSVDHPSATDGAVPMKPGPSSPGLN